MYSSSRTKVFCRSNVMLWHCIDFGDVKNKCVHNALHKFYERSSRNWVFGNIFRCISVPDGTATEYNVSFKSSKYHPSSIGSMSGRSGLFASFQIQVWKWVLFTFLENLFVIDGKLFTFGIYMYSSLLWHFLQQNFYFTFERTASNTSSTIAGTPCSLLFE
jgi:hypothetical protein